VLTIGDREADIFDLFAAPRRGGAHLLIRAVHQRRIADTPEGETAYIWPIVQEQPPAGTLTVSIQPVTQRAGREATLTVRHCSVEVQPPRHHRARAQCQPQRLHAMLAIEADPPAGQTPLTWRLLTTWPVETDEDVLALIEAYSLRWHRRTVSTEAWTPVRKTTRSGTCSNGMIVPSRTMHCTRKGLN
jgi:hypothetical protein